MGAAQLSNDDPAGVALLLIDLINDFDFDGGDDLLKETLPLVPNIVTLKEKAQKAGVPVVYVNDNFGRWRSDLRSLVAHCLEDGVRGQPVVERLLPGEHDYFVLKPRHSGFYSSSLDSLLEYLCVKTLVLAGIAGDICVWFTANDAYMREYQIIAPSDCLASEDPENNRMILQQMQRVLKADTRPSTELDLGQLRAAALE